MSIFPKTDNIHTRLVHNRSSMLAFLFSFVFFRDFFLGEKRGGGGGGVVKGRMTKVEQ